MLVLSDLIGIKIWLQYTIILIGVFVKTLHNIIV
jgi:hypothetical protein